MLVLDLNWGSACNQLITKYLMIFRCDVLLAGYHRYWTSEEAGLPVAGAGGARVEVDPWLMDELTCLSEHNRKQQS